jgi:hypothetical protein
MHHYLWIEALGLRMLFKPFLLLLGSYQRIIIALIFADLIRYH